MITFIDNITQQRLKSEVSYNPLSGLFFWVKPGRRRTIGVPIGCVSKYGYITIQINKQKYQAHRLAWLYVNGEFPKTELDHINRNRKDNRIDNLRTATRFDNMKNMTRHKDGKSGKKGVSWHKNRKCWNAQIMIEGRNKFLGHFDNKDDAALTYDIAAKKHYKEFASTNQ